MESVHIRFDNFKKFVADSAPNSLWVTLLSGVPLEAFLRGVYEKAEQEPGLTIGQITNKVLEQAGLRREQFTLGNIAKFQLYCEYFINVSRQLYGAGK